MEERQLSCFAPGERLIPCSVVQVDALGHSLHQGHVEDDDVELVLSDMGDSVDSDKLGFPPASPTR